MTFTVRRRCSKFEDDAPSPLPFYLEECRETSAYVLLGEPGAGKTTAFEQEAGSEETGCLVTAREFAAAGDRQEWHGKTLFIDGLDEIRAGETNPYTPLDRIHSNLRQLGVSKFRLSCRAADWLGTSDRSPLDALLPGDETIKVLRLEPLSPRDIKEILGKRLHVADAGEFIESAHQKGLGHLLDNPQSLEMLSLAVAKHGGRWPEDRKQAFDLACEKLLEEGNPGRKRGRMRSVSEPDLLGAAGKLFAIQLLTGRAGYSLESDENLEEYLPLNRIPHANPNEFDEVFDSRLFRVPRGNCAEPYHRHVAEFLGARYLAQRVDEGLPIARILTLTTGYEGKVVPEFRGLMAWLASHSLTGRKELIGRDPYGTVEYGCVREFSTDEKCYILSGLERESRINPWFAFTLSHDHRLGDLASADMREKFLGYFDVSDPDDAQQSFARLCLKALASGTGTPEMPDVALGLLKNSKWGLPVRRVALDLFLQQVSNDKQRPDVLLGLLEEIRRGTISDPSDDLAGRLLKEVYPEILSPSQILSYLHPPKRANYLGPYCYFWTHEIIRESTKEQLGKLLDFLVKLFDLSPEEFSHNFDQFNHLRGLPERWLEFYLENFEDEPDPHLLIHWLELIRASQRNISDKKIGKWLSRHPETLLEIFDLGIKQCEELDSPDCLHHAMERLADAALPRDFAAWCLEKAIIMENPEVAQYLIRWTAYCVRNNYCDAGLSPEIVEGRLSAKSDLFQIFVEHQENAASDDALIKQHQEKYDAELLERQQEWHAYFKPMQGDLRANRCNSDVLQNLAVAYYGGYRDVKGDTPRERLENLLGQDDDLVESVLQAFRALVDREDLPSPDEVIRLGEKCLLPYPYMAGLNEISETSRDKSLPINEEQMRLALAVYYTVPLLLLPSRTGDDTPQWFPSLLQSRPDLVSEILVKATRKKLRRPSDSIWGLYELAHSTDYKEVARMASLPLLKAFPVRCSRQRLQDLNHLLIAAVLYCEEKTLLNIIDQKLSSRTMHVGQRIRWLAAGLFTAPEQYQDRLESCISGHEPRIRALAEIMTSRFLDALPDCPSVSVLSFLIRLLGSSYGPYYFSDDDSSMKGCLVRLDMEAPHSIRFFCEQLAKMPTPEATESLELLRTEETLRAWHPNLTDLAYQQKIRRRETDFRHRNVEEVLRVIEHARPVGPADLVATAITLLEEVAKDIRDGDTSDWQTYWKSEEGKPVPQHEDFCRNRLRSKLEPRSHLLGIGIETDSLCVNNKRPDFRFSCNGFKVPVEIKKSNNRHLWVAIENQLIRRYVRGPETGGNGIYVALWFGKEFCKATESGTLPEDADHLKQCLLETLSEKERNKIKVCVIDVAWQS